VVVPPLPPIPELGPIGMAEPGKSLSWSQLEELATDAPAPLVVDEPAEKESLFSKLTGGKKKKKSKKTKKTD
jgi:hypothetical protein